MTISGWITLGLLAFIICLMVFCLGLHLDSKSGWVISVVIATILIAVLFAGMRWYYSNTASGKRALVDQKSELNNGLERTIKIYTANGDVIAEYTGEIDIEGNDGGYVLFDYNGKRYTYYNCFVESIAEIEQ